VKESGIVQDDSRIQSTHNLYIKEQNINNRDLIQIHSRKVCDMGDKRKRRRDFDDDDWFGFDMDEEFDRMRKRMEMLMGALAKNRDSSFEKPFVYGFSMRAGPDGKPKIREFGNTTPVETGQEVQEREPLTDIIEHSDSISVTVEIPGVDKKDIDLDVHVDSLDIKVDSDNRKYHKELELPAKVLTDSAKATYKNGVLDIVLEKAKSIRGKKVSID
jgi:HSP20 family protein